MGQREHFINANRKVDMEAFIRHQQNVPARNPVTVKVEPSELVKKANASILKILLDEKDLKKIGLL